MKPGESMSGEPLLELMRSHSPRTAAEANLDCTPAP